jgi:hypothetical protein
MSRVIDIRLGRRRVIVGWNAEPTLRFGRRRERLFTAYGLGPLLVGVGPSPETLEERVNAKLEALAKEIRELGRRPR